jgi:hypothetical protein
MGGAQTEEPGLDRHTHQSGFSLGGCGSIGLGAGIGRNFARWGASDLSQKAEPKMLSWVNDTQRRFWQETKLNYSEKVGYR